MKTKPSWMSCVAVAAGLAVGVSAHADPYDPPAGYYSNATGAGTTLKAQLTAAMSAGHIQRTYGDFRTMAAYSDADPGTPGNIFLVYNRASIPGAWTSGATWDREHVWPQSHQPGSASNSTTGNLGDPHALRPCNPSINSSRGNKPFGFASTVGLHGHQGSFYFPGDSDKGDIARSLFYSDTRWTSLGLSLVNTTPGTNQMGNLDSLVAWNYLDPPDAYERRRNHVIWGAEGNPFPTNNRNAYIDNPWFVWSVYVDQANDSRLSVGSSPGADGASEAVILLDDALVGDPAPSTIVTLHRIGNDGTYFEVTPGVGATSSITGKFNAFPINGTGSDSRDLTVGFEAGSTAGAGAKAVEVVIDNLDITTDGGPGRGGNDADDVITLELIVLDHADASFDPLMDDNMLEIDFGTIAQGAGDAVVSFDLYNLAATDPMFVAALDVDPLTAIGDLAALTTTLGVVDALPSSASFEAVLDDESVGMFFATYTFRTFDDRSIPTAAEGGTLTIQLTGVVAPALCPGDVGSDLIVDVDDLNAVLSAWGVVVGLGSPLDLAGNDGFVDVDDLNVVLGNWGADCS